MTGAILLTICLFLYAALAQYLHQQLLIGYERQKVSLLRARNHDHGRRFRIYVITSLSLFLGLMGAAAYAATRVDYLSSSLHSLALVGLVLLFWLAVNTIIGWALSLYPFTGGFRGRYIVERVPLRTLFINLALVVPAAGLLCGIAILSLPG